MGLWPMLEPCMGQTHTEHRRLDENVLFDDGEASIVR